MRYATKREQKNAYNNWKCNVCGEVFRTRILLEQHKKDSGCIDDHSAWQLSTKKTYCCKFCGKEWLTTKSGFVNHEKHCPKNKDATPWKGHGVSEETRKKISEGLKKAIKEGRATGWHKRKAGTRSYPEKWMASIIENEFSDKDYVDELHVGKYRLDFAWPKKMLYIEIDGKQHEERKDKDLEKDNFCKSLGWKVLRMPWCYIVANKQIAIEQMKNFIDNGIPSEIEWTSKEEEFERAHIESGCLKNSIGCWSPRKLSDDVWETRK